MKERKGIVTLAGRPVTLIGNEVNVGEPAPDVELITPDLEPVKLSAFRGKLCVISSVPSLEHPEYDEEVRHFNLEAQALDPKVTILTVSMDLPFAQKRWRDVAQVDRIHTLSDYLKAAFGLAYGVLIKEFRLLSRAMFVVDEEGIIRYRQLVPDNRKVSSPHWSWSDLQRRNSARA